MVYIPLVIIVIQCPIQRILDQPDPVALLPILIIIQITLLMDLVMEEIIITLEHIIRYRRHFTSTPSQVIIPTTRPARIMPGVLGEAAVEMRTRGPDR